MGGRVGAPGGAGYAWRSAAWCSPWYVPDVAADAGDATGLALINSYPSGPVMATAAGTSAGAPFWAGLVALADQYAGRDLGSVNPAIYRIAHSARYDAVFMTSKRPTTPYS